MRVILTGGSGILGRYLMETAGEAHQLYTDRFDILDKEAITKAFDECKPELVIHCAGEGSVDKAEAFKRDAFNLNVVGTENLLEEALKHKVHFVYISTNAVYDGEHAPYSEISGRHPLNYYGITKVEAEKAVLMYPFKSSIYRLIFLYGWTPRGSRAHFLTRILASLKAGKHVEVAKDIITQPTHAWDSANAVWRLTEVQEKPSDVFNIASRKAMSLYAFALDVAGAFGFDPSLVVPVRAMDLKGLAFRPRDTSFDVSKLELAGFVFSPPDKGLLEMQGKGGEDVA